MGNGSGRSWVEESTSCSRPLPRLEPIRIRKGDPQPVAHPSCCHSWGGSEAPSSRTWRGRAELRATTARGDSWAVGAAPPITTHHHTATTLPPQRTRQLLQHPHPQVDPGAASEPGVQPAQPCSGGAWDTCRNRCPSSGQLASKGDRSKAGGSLGWGLGGTGRGTALNSDA